MGTGILPQRDMVGALTLQCDPCDGTGHSVRLSLGECA